jgi:hypothetical protein
MKEYKINELFQWEDRTLMCVEKGIYDCKKCYFHENIGCGGVECGDYLYYTNKLVFSAEGIKLQIKRKGAKVKVKVLELSEEFYGIENDKFTLYKANVLTAIYYDSLAVYEIGDKIQHIFPTEQEAIDWVDRLFSLRGE